MYGNYSVHIVIVTSHGHSGAVPTQACQGPSLWQALHARFNGRVQRRQRVSVPLLQEEEQA